MKKNVFFEQMIPMSASADSMSNLTTRNGGISQGKGLDGLAHALQVSEKLLAFLDDQLPGKILVIFNALEKIFLYLLQVCWSPGHQP